MEFLDLSIAAAVARQNIEQQPHGTHADEIETSNMLYVAPQVVRMYRAVPELAPQREGPLTRDPDAQKGVYSATGSWGDPTLATVEKGKIVTEAIVAEIIQFLHEEFAV